MRRKSLIFTSVVLALAVLAWGVGPGWAESLEVTNKVIDKANEWKLKKEAAARAKDLGLKPGVAGVAAAFLPIPFGFDGPGGIPHYFGPYGNWAYSPLPRAPSPRSLSWTEARAIPTLLQSPSTMHTA